MTARSNRAAAIISAAALALLTTFAFCAIDGQARDIDAESDQTRAGQARADDPRDAKTGSAETRDSQAGRSQSCTPDAGQAEGKGARHLPRRTSRRRLVLSLWKSLAHGRGLVPIACTTW